MAKVTKASIITPIILIIFYILVLALLRSIFPTGKSLVDALSSIYGKFGYEIIVIGSLLEALIVINFFIPGVAAVGLGVVFAKAGELDLTLAIVAAVLGALVGFTLDFMLGRFGFGELIYRIGHREILDKAKAQIDKSGIRAFSLGFIHPNIGALISLAAGALRMDFKRFFILALLSTLVWYIIWGLTIFALGQIFLMILTKYVFMLFLLIAAIWLLVTIYGTTRKS